MSQPTIALDEATINRIASRTNAMVLDNLLELGLENITERIAEHLRTSEDTSTTEAATRLVDARTLADALGCSRDCVYAHADELGGQRIGDGPRGRLRFDLDQALEAWTSRSENGGSRRGKGAAQRPISRRARAPRMGSSPELLPIRGSSANFSAGTEVV
jgi:hypothetical protein